MCCYKSVVVVAAISNLDFSRAVVHHAVLGCHGFVGVQRGGVEGDLLDAGDAADSVGLARASGLILVLPVGEELLEKGGLTTSRHHLDLCT